MRRRLDSHPASKRRVVRSRELGRRAQLSRMPGDADLARPSRLVQLPARACSAVRTTRQAGFTLMEMMLAMTLLALMMGMVYAALSLSARAWDAGDKRVAEASSWRQTERFLRREWSQLFPTRWRATVQPHIAIEGSQSNLRYVTALNLEAVSRNAAGGGLQWAELALDSDGKLVLNRQTFDSAAQNFDTLSTPSRDDQNAGKVAPPVTLADNIKSVEFAYFGSDTDLIEPTWREEWRELARLPKLIRLRVETARGRDLPDIIVAPRLGEEAGCLINNFVRQCGARPR
jgi:general secretion pathway protein J